VTVRFNSDLADCSWTVPVPVKRSRFAAMDPLHDECNVEADLAAIGAFASDRERSTATVDLLHADLQTLPLGNVARRLGSGNAGSYRGVYLKGIGRTPLAADWAHGDDRRRERGHMLPSAAAREYLVSRALVALGLGDSIVACSGLLAADLEHPDDAMPGAAGCFAPADGGMQALTVKRADFARLSNFVWALDHVGSPGDLGELLFRVHSYLLPPGQRPGNGSGSSPAAIAAALAAAIERGIANFGCWMRAGVSWAALGNCLAADGRFVDLEAPMVLLRPFFGTVSQPSSPWAGGWFGLEVFAYVLEARALVATLRERVRFLARHVFVRGVTHDFCAALALELDEQLPAEHVLWSRQRLVDEAVVAIVEALGIERASAARVRSIADRQYGVVFDDERPDWSDVRLRRLDLRVAAPAPGPEWVCAFPDFLAGVCTDDLEAARLFNDGLRWIDGSRGVDDLFKRTQSATRWVEDALGQPAARISPRVARMIAPS